MEILAFIVVVIVGIVIYHNLPQTKFNKAIKLMESGDLELALERFFNIKEKHDEAIVKIAEIKYKLTEQMLTSGNTEKVVAEYQSILNLRKDLQRSNFDNNGLSAIENKTRQAINETYYQYALELLRKGKKEAALKELEKLKEKHPLAGLKIAQIKLQDAKKLLNEDREKALLVFKEVLEIRKGITSFKENTTKFNSIENEARDAIASIYYDKGKDYYESNQLDLATDLFKKSLEWVVNDKVKTNCLIALSETIYRKGTQYEKRKNFKQAVSHYEKALNYVKTFYKNDFFYNIQSRIEICDLKQRKRPSKEIIHFLLDKNFPSKNDLMFRYALLLAKEGDISACENILDIQFKMSNNSEIKKLRRFCNEYYQKKALEKMIWVDEVIFGKKKVIQRNISRTSKIKIGIHLGTKYSVVGFKTKAVEILRNKENEELTRSCVGQKEVDSEILVGRSAFQLLKRNPENTILSVKLLMGVGYQDEITQRMIAETRKTGGYYKYGITRLQGGTENAVAVILQGKQYTPEQISAEILKKLKKDAEFRLGDEVTHAVITVPAYFTDKQKNATRLAAKYAGLKVQKLLAEPTAAAIAYGIDDVAEGEAKTVLIYDFGGNTFDLSILNIVDGQYLEMGTGGDRWLGGDDIDKALSDYIYERTCEEYGIDINRIDDLIDNLPKRIQVRFLSDFKEQVQEVKISLSSAQHYDFILGGLEDGNGNEVDIDITITRQEFEKLIRPFVQRSIDLIEELVNDMNYDMDMIDNVLLVGGTSSIPLVKEMLVAKYGYEKIKVSKKPMLAIAEGAAILAHRLDDSYEEAEGDTTIIDVPIFTTSHDYFIKLNIDGVDTTERVIEKQMPIPATATKIYKTTTDNQRLICIDIENDVENGKKERVALGFYLIEDNVPIGTSFVFEFKVGSKDNDDTVDVTAYPQGERHKSKALILGRGGVDEKVLNALNHLVQRAIKETRTKETQDEVIELVASKVKEIDSIGINKISNEDWGRIYYQVEEEYQTIIRYEK